MVCVCVSVYTKNGKILVKYYCKREIVSPMLPFLLGSFCKALNNINVCFSLFSVPDSSYNKDSFIL